MTDYIADLWRKMYSRDRFTSWSGYWLSQIAFMKLLGLAFLLSFFLMALILIVDAVVIRLA